MRVYHIHPSVQKSIFLNTFNDVCGFYYTSHTSLIECIYIINWMYIKNIFLFMLVTEGVTSMFVDLDANSVLGDVSDTILKLV